MRNRILGSVSVACIALLLMGEPALAQRRGVVTRGTWVRPSGVSVNRAYYGGYRGVTGTDPITAIAGVIGGGTATDTAPVLV
jgi:hypothetical protein